MIKKKKCDHTCNQEKEEFIFKTNQEKAYRSHDYPYSCPDFYYVIKASFTVLFFGFIFIVDLVS